ncbi:MAG: ankyrin repeat domain-containing protein [Bacteriovorax sp.]|jgi:ankyrin repeat protein
MKNIKHILLHYFEWSRTVYLITIALILISAYAINYFPIASEFKPILIYCNLIVALAFHFITRFQPVQGQAPNGFSLKFFQGIPLKKDEIILSVVACSLLSTIPIILCTLLFSEYVNRTFHLNLNALKISINASFILLLLSMVTTKSIIEFPRKEDERKNPFRPFIKILRQSSVSMFAILISLLLFLIVDDYFHWNLAKELLSFLESLPKYLTSWWSTLFFVLFFLYHFFEVHRLWTNEILTYKKQYWNAKKEYALLAISGLGTLFFFMLIDLSTPEIYIGTVQKAVYESKYDLLKNISPEKINTTNYYGVTPMMVAVGHGDLKMIQYLESKGANYEGKIVNEQKLNGMDNIMLAIRRRDLSVLKYISTKTNNLTRLNQELGFYPIHYATGTCQSDVVDYLVEQNVDVNVLNKDGETPLMVSARANCWSVAVVLKEAGAKFDAKDMLGKTALEKIKNPKSKKELVYFFQKNSRVPASK